mgnify:FL=1|jgi:peptidyl-prolyl isomerase, gliding motility-associated
MYRFLYFFIFFIVISCAKKEARRPVTIKTNTFLKESAQKNRKLLIEQEAEIDAIVAKDTLHNYLSSKDGFKYYYIEENKNSDYTPKFGDIIDFTYSISDIYGKEIYSKDDKKIVTYHMDKEELFQGLRLALKRMKEGEEAVFFLPSELAFGYHGDNNKIGVNKPVKVQVHILKITEVKEEEPQEE